MLHHGCVGGEVGGRDRLWIISVHLWIGFASRGREDVGSQAVLNYRRLTWPVQKFMGPVKLLLFRGCVGKKCGAYA
jgi:hypothetical protein